MNPPDDRVLQQRHPYLQIIAALPVLSFAVEAALAGTLTTRMAEGSSGVWYHPGCSSTWQAGSGALVRRRLARRRQHNGAARLAMTGAHASRDTGSSLSRRSITE